MIYFQELFANKFVVVWPALCSPGFVAITATLVKSNCTALLEDFKIPIHKYKSRKCN